MGSPVVVASPRKSPSSVRRANKPLVEKKRRARINGCLGQLKSLILHAMKTEGAQVSRLEKADILEMTVKYLRHVQCQQVTTVVKSEPEVVAKFNAGYTECAAEVIRYMDSVKGVTRDVRSKLESHLVERLRGSVTIPTPTAEAAALPASVPLSTTPIPSYQAPQQIVVSSVYPSQVIAHPSLLMNHSTLATSNSMVTHYQTAVDLANLASAVTAKESVAVAVATSQVCALPSQKDIYSISTSPLFSSSSSSSSSTPSSACVPIEARVTRMDTQMARAQSTSPSNQSIVNISTLAAAAASSSSSPSHLAEMERSDARRRHNSSGTETVTKCMRNANVTYRQDIINDLNNNYLIDRNRNTMEHLNNNNSNNSNNNNNTYLNAFQLPLHIHIPEMPALHGSPSPPLLQAHPAQAQEGIHDNHHISNKSAVDTPPTILYGTSDYHVMQFPSDKTSDMSRTSQGDESTSMSPSINPTTVEEFNTNAHVQKTATPPPPPPPPSVTLPPTSSPQIDNNTIKGSTPPRIGYARAMWQPREDKSSPGQKTSEFSEASSGGERVQTMFHVPESCSAVEPTPTPTHSATPSPPTLTREEPYQNQHQQHALAVGHAHESGSCSTGAGARPAVVSDYGMCRENSAHMPGGIGDDDVGDINTGNLLSTHRANVVPASTSASPPPPTSYYFRGYPGQFSSSSFCQQSRTNDIPSPTTTNYHHQLSHQNHPDYHHHTDLRHNTRHRVEEENINDFNGHRSVMTPEPSPRGVEEESYNHRYDSNSNSRSSSSNTTDAFCYTYPPSPQADSLSPDHHRHNNNSRSSSSSNISLNALNPEPAHLRQVSPVNNCAPIRQDSPSRGGSRQNEEPLSPPTLKKRLLFAHRSEGVGSVPAALRCSEAHLWAPDTRMARSVQNGHALVDLRPAESRQGLACRVPAVVTTCEAAASANSLHPHHHRRSFHMHDYHHHHRHHHHHPHPHHFLHRLSSQDHSVPLLDDRVWRPW